MDSMNSRIRRNEPFWGEWYIDSLLGKGSYGTVFKIKKEALGKSYYSALKCISLNENQYIELGENKVNSILEEMMNEVEILYSLKGHTNIVSYEDFTTKEPENEKGIDIFIRMEYLTPLTNYLKSNHLTREEVIKLGIDLAEALILCEKNNIIHRDIKEANIFISNTGNYKLGDFGVSKKLIEENEGSLSFQGTPLYIAPEVYKCLSYDHRADIYSLGLVLFKLTNSGNFPFVSQQNQLPTNIANQKRLFGETLPLPSLSTQSFGKVILKSCAYDPNNRYHSAIQLKQDLERLLEQMTLAEREEIIIGQGAIVPQITSSTENEVSMHSTQATIRLNDYTDRTKVPSWQPEDPTIGQKTIMQKKESSIKSDEPYISASQTISSPSGYKKSKLRQKIVIGAVTASLLGGGAYIWGQSNLSDGSNKNKQEAVEKNNLEPSESSSSGEETNTPVFEDSPAETPEITTLKEFTPNEFSTTSIKGKVILTLVSLDRQTEQTIVKVTIENNFNKDVKLFGAPSLISKSSKTEYAPTFEGNFLGNEVIAAGTMKECEFIVEPIPETDSELTLSGSLWTMDPIYGQDGDFNLDFTIDI